MNIYDFKATTAQGKEKSLSDYKGKVLLIVNTASKCGFTPQYKELQEIYLKYKEQGFEILGFPCNQFAEQEPGSNEEVQEFCRFNYGVTFQIFAKGDVREESAQPLFKYLTTQKGFKGFNMKHPVAKALMDALENKFPSFLEGDSVKWNFTKFLIAKDGTVVGRYEPTSTPKELCTEIEKQLQAEDKN